MPLLLLLRRHCCYDVTAPRTVRFTERYMRAEVICDLILRDIDVKTF